MWSFVNEIHASERMELDIDQKPPRVEYIENGRGSRDAQQRYGVIEPRLRQPRGT